MENLERTGEASPERTDGKNLRIAVFANTFPAPSETFILNQVVELKNRGHDVHVFAYRPRQAGVIHPTFHDAAIGGRVHYPWKIAPSLTIRKILGMLNLALCPRPARKKILDALDQQRFGWWAKSWHLFYWACLLSRQKRFDVVHAHFLSIGGLAGMLKQLNILSAPLVTSFHGADVTSQESSSSEALLRSFCKSQTSLFTFNTCFIRDKAIEIGFPIQQMRQLRVGLEMHRFPFIPRRPQTKKIKILSVARLAEAKGIHIAIEAATHLRSHGMDFEYKVIGDGPWKKRLLDLIATNRLENHVTLAGWKDQAAVVEAMQVADIFMLPSITAADQTAEGQGLALQEAQAVGVPVVATLHNGFPENISDGLTGLLVPEKDPVALANAVLRIANDPTLRQLISTNARAYVERTFDSKKLVLIQEEIFREAIGDHLRDLPR